MVKAPRKKPAPKKARASRKPTDRLTPEEVFAEIYMVDEIMVPALVAGRYEALYLHCHGGAEIRAPKYNDFFSPWSNAVTTFLSPFGNEKWVCAACGKKRGNEIPWSQFVPFRAGFMIGFAMGFSPLLDPLTPVCGDHPLSTWPQLCDEPEVNAEQAGIADKRFNRRF